MHVFVLEHARVALTTSLRLTIKSLDKLRTAIMCVPELFVSEPIATNKHLRLLIGPYRSGTVNSNTVNSKFHLIRSFFEILARILSFHV